MHDHALVGRSATFKADQIARVSDALYVISIEPLDQNVSLHMLFRPVKLKHRKAVQASPSAGSVLAAALNAAMASQTRTLRLKKYMAENITVPCQQLPELLVQAAPMPLYPGRRAVGAAGALVGCFRRGQPKP